MPSNNIIDFTNHLNENIDDNSNSQNIVLFSTRDEERERKNFMQDINKFMSEIGKPLSKIPIMGYKELDLYQLFKEVCSYGGFNEVVKNVGTWSKIWKRLGNFDPSITDSSFRLKKNYERYLLEYEYKCFPEHRQQAIEYEKQIQLKKNQHLYYSQENNINTPMVGSYKITKIENSKNSKIKKNNNNNNNINNNNNNNKKKIFNIYKDITRDKNGTVKMPLVLGDLTIENIGTIIPKYPYVTEKHIWPIGFCSSRYFSSMNNPEKKVKYTSKIIDIGDRPQFVVTAADDPQNPIISNSPSGAWRTVLKIILAKNGSEEIRKSISVSGTLRFGLAHPIVSHLIRELPNSDKCHDIINNSPDSPISSPISSPILSPTSPIEPWSHRKRKSSDDSSSEENLDDENFKVTKYSSDSFDEEIDSKSVLFATREELEDLESAVATLQALKYCAVY